MANKLLIVLAALLLAGCGDGHKAKPKQVDMTGIVSLRELPGPDGCMPATTYTPPHRFKGERFPDVCDSANAPY